jgi:hypothetical protein
MIGQLYLRSVPRSGVEERCNSIGKGHQDFALRFIDIDNLVAHGTIVGFFYRNVSSSSDTPNPAMSTAQYAANGVIALRFLMTLVTVTAEIHCFKYGRFAGALRVARKAHAQAKT